MYNEELALAILKRLKKEFPGAMSSDDIREQMSEFKLSREEFHTAIDALTQLGQVTSKPVTEGMGYQYFTDVKITSQGLESLKPANSPAQKTNLVFLSHAASDEKLALRLNTLIETAILGSKVFATSDPEDLEPGADWVDIVLDNLSRAAMLVVLATERGINRRWVWYETGAGWSRHLRIIPVCVGTLRKGQLPPPFLGYQQLNIDTTNDLGALLKVISKELALPQVPADLEACVSDLKTFDLECATTSGMLTQEQRKLRVDLANVSVKINQGIAQNFLITVTNESNEDVLVRRIILAERVTGTRLSDPYEPEEPIAALAPKRSRQYGWHAAQDPAANLNAIVFLRRADKQAQYFQTEIVVTVVCEILGMIKECPTPLHVQVDSWNKQITSLTY